MSSQLQLEYLDAVLCMMELPSITPFNGTKTRFDDFQALHAALTYGIHWVVGYFILYILVNLPPHHFSARVNFCTITEDSFTSTRKHCGKIAAIVVRSRTGTGP